MGITVLKNNVPWGPFTRSQIQNGIERGDFTLQYLAHAPGLKEWLPLGEVLDHVDRGAKLPPVPAVQEDLPPIPDKKPPLAASKIELMVEPPQLLSAIKIDVAKAIPPALPQSKSAVIELRPASFFQRLVALIIDALILFAPIALIFALRAIMLEVQGAWENIDHQERMEEWELLKRNFHQMLLLIAVGLGWLYAAGLESSRWQGTVGKQWMGIKVTDTQGERLGFVHATGRHLAKYLSALPCFLGFIAALFSSQGRALHDRLAGTRVLKK